MILLYIFAIIIIIILFICAYIRIKFPFWAIQPIFHIYDIWYYICPPGIIQLDLPKREDKYNNFINIKTKSLDDISQLDKSRFVDFIQQHFLREKSLHYAPKAENIWPYMEGLEGGSTYISFYNTEDMVIDTKTNDISKTDKILGTMVSYPLQVVINNGKPDAFFDIYYVDYLCVHSDHRNKSIAPQLIQTHNYHHRHRNPKIQTCLFKREGHFTAAIPLCVYTAYGYNISSIYEKPDGDEIPPNINLIEVSHKNMSHLVDFIKTTQNKYKISISPSLANISSLIKTENVFIYLLIQGNIVLSAYYFKKQCSYIIRNDNAKKTEILTCFASITAKNVADNIFINGFKKAIRQIVEKYPNYSELMIEGKSDNVLLNNKLSSVITTIFAFPCAYYFYNFAYAVYNPEETFILI
jgi:hypothetical protein